MLYYEGLTCPVCQKRFEEGEDIVSCPHCGLPHHRSCWMQENRCHDADNHGTENQWSREKANKDSQKGYVAPEGQPSNGQICPHCYTKNFEYAEFCAHCGRSLQSTDWHSSSNHEQTYSPFTFDTTAPMNEKEKELSAIIGANTQYYLPRFRNLQSGKSGGWNWAAFLLGPFWLIYRKQYLLGSLLFIFQAILNVASILFPVPQVMTPAEAQTVLNSLSSNPMWIAVMLLSSLILIARILLGIKGNALYLYHCKRRIEKAKCDADDLSAAELGSFGGVSVTVTVVFMFLSTIIEYIAFYFAQFFQ